MTTDNFCFYLQNRLIQTSQTVGQWYSDTSPFSIPWASVFVAGKPLQPTLMFVGKAAAYLSQSIFQLLHSMVGSRPYAQTLD